MKQANTLVSLACLIAASGPLKAQTVTGNRARLPEKMEAQLRATEAKVNSGQLFILAHCGPPSEGCF